jgi:hypothetical protein
LDGGSLFTQEEYSITNTLSFVMSEVAPCDGCDHRQRCASGMACSAFSYYVQTGIVSRDRKNGAPTVLRYRQLFERKERSV